MTCFLSNSTGISIVAQDSQQSVICSDPPIFMGKVGYDGEYSASITIPKSIVAKLREKNLKEIKVMIFEK
ncbi:MAG: hypothetical protein WBZ36_23555 [Candidatus Nitrosopolaris sp.]